VALQFILGPPGSGKTTHCLNEIHKHLPGDAPLYYLVPEQFSLQSERLLLAEYSAAIRVQVLSFNRLAYRLFALLGGPPGKIADELARSMILRKVLFENAESFVYYQSTHDKHGFVESLAVTLTELNHYRVTAGDLKTHANDDSALSAKISDLSLILTKYREAVTGRFLLTDDMLDLLVQRLETTTEKLPLLDKTYIWVDGFSGFTPQERLVLFHILKRAEYVGITLTTRDKPHLTDSLCDVPRQTMEKLLNITKKAGIQTLPDIYTTKNHRHIHNPGLAFFVSNFSIYAKQGKTFPNIPGDNAGDFIEMIPVGDPYAAVLAAVTRIQEWKQKRGYRFRDIAILCGDRKRYEKILHTVFDRFFIPLFVDTETDILSHPLTELIRAAFDIVNRNYNYESVFRFFKTGLTGIQQDDVDILENYALAYGTNGYRWRYPMTDPKAEAVRLCFMSGINDFGKMKKKDTVLAFSQKVFDLLYTLNVPETLSRWYDESMNGNDPETARKHKQIWPKVSEIFDKLVEILGDTVVNLQEFASLLDAGLSQAGLGCIPPTLDQVILGDMNRSRYPKIKAMIVLGANEGVLPPLPVTPGLFTDDERNLLRNDALELAPAITDRVNESYYALYGALSQPSDILSFIYAQTDSGGKVLRPSPVLRTIKTLFPLIEPKTVKTMPEYMLLTDKTIPEYTPLTHLNIEKNPFSISETSVNQLFGPVIHTAASRLEAYASCPFAYYMTYLLKAKPRKQYEVLPTDLGNLFHDVVACFALEAGWLPRTKPEIDEIVTALVHELTPETAVYHGSARNRYILEKARRVCTASIWALTEQIKKESYQPVFAETDLPPSPPIPLGNGRSLLLSGRIDRVDLLDSEDGNTYVKIIDYKSGRTRFSEDDLRQGTQLQLMIYMNAMLKAPGLQDKNPKPGGIYYFPIDDPLLKTDRLLDDTVREAGLLKSFKTSGLDFVGNDDFLPLSYETDKKIKELTLRLTSGDITPNPCYKNGRRFCTYCLFPAVCKKED
jgi:ATP-dependent helicase/nuclease subunit B